MKNQKKIFGFVAFCALLGVELAFVNCSGVSFSSSSASGNGIAAAGPGGTGTGTTTTATTCGGTSNIRVPVKVLMVVDQSGSNAIETQDEGTEACQNPNNTNCAPPTDPNKSFRGGSISTFFTNNKANANFSWGFVGFSGNEAYTYIGNGGANAIFGNAAAMQTAITQFGQSQDGGDTPYISALNSIQYAIANDAGIGQPADTGPLYEIIFLSDGYPTDALNSDGTVNIQQINQAVSGISSLAPGRIFLSSVYYGTIDDPNAASTLQTMATTGKGQFVNADTGSTSTISIDNLITVPTTDCTN